MTASVSPTTFGTSPFQFRPMAEVTYSSGWRIPRTEDECERLLDASAVLAMTPAFCSFLAGFLGAASSVWTSPRRNRLREILSAGGVVASLAVLGAVAHTPRAEVVDDAVEMLIEAAGQDERVAAALAGLLVLAKAERNALVGDHPAVRATIARALARMRGPRTRDVRLVALAIALVDPSTEVRDAAIQALGSSGDPVAQRLLAQQRPKEAEPFLVEAIDDALAELRGD
jgi:hypothetical protein